MRFPNAGLFQSELRRHIASAKAAMKGRDPDHLRHIETDIVDSSEMLEHAAYLAMAAMLVGPLFDADARDPGGRVFVWVDRMLAARDASTPIPGGLPLADVGVETTWGPPKEHVARGALQNVLRSTPELAPVFVERCYSQNPRVASAYFVVLSEVYAAVPLPLEAYVVVALVLHKVMDALPAARDAARGMLGTLARRLWSQNLNLRRSATSALAGQGPSVSSEVAAEDSNEGAVVVGSLAESHQAYQQHLSAMLARDHAELAHGVAMEVLMRHQGSAAGATEALLCLPPWLEYANFGRQYEGQWGPNVLRALYAVTAQPGASRALAAQKLWATVASNRRNIVPTLDFLMKQGIAESSATGPSARGGAATSACVVGKQVALYLSRVAPRQTIDHLTHEAALQMEEPDDYAAQVARTRRGMAQNSPGPYTPLYGTAGLSRGQSGEIGMVSSASNWVN